MNPSRMFLCSALTLLALSVARPASAQFAPTYNPATQARVSPYLNLLRAGTAPGINYFGIVRPELEFRNGIQQLGVQTRTNEQAITGLQANAGLPTTGHPVGFQNHLSYFQNIGAPGQTGFGVGVGGQTPGLGAQPLGAAAGGRTPPPKR